MNDWRWLSFCLCCRLGEISNSGVWKLNVEEIFGIFFFKFKVRSFAELSHDNGALARRNYFLSDAVLYLPAESSLSIVA